MAENAKAFFCCDPMQIDGVGNLARKKFAQGLSNAEALKVLRDG